MSSLYSSSEWINSPQHTQMLEMFFQNSPIKIDMEMHDTQRVIGKQLVLGPWAGPMQCITHIIHEMAHLAEIDDKRILKTGWGLQTPTQYIPGRYSYIAPMPTTCQPSEREARTIALQWQIQSMLGIQETPREALNSLKYLPDWCMIPYERTEGETMYEYDEKRYVYLENYMMQSIKEKYTLDFFMKEWKRKNELLKKAMQS